MPEETGGVGYSWFLLELTSEHVEPPGEEEPSRGGGTGEQVYGAGPWIIPWEQHFEGRVALRKQTRLILASGVLAKPAPALFEQSIGGRVNVSKEFAVTFSGTRSPALHWNRLVQEDEELLLSL